MDWKKISNVLGPGILFASTAIGVSHLVQSTRAGANFGYALLWAIIAANLFKYPFFEYGSRYASASGESLIDGYKRMGKPVLWGYFLVTIASMFFVTAAVAFVTAGFMDNLFGLSKLAPNFKQFPILILFLACLPILLLGKFNALNSLIKVLGIVLFISTLLAFILTLIQGPVERIPNFVPRKVFDEAGIVFLIALMGWMPTALDLSAWNSLWTIEKIKLSAYKPTLKETLFEFNLGYWIAAGLSICFLILGAFLVFGSKTSMPEGNVAFANSIIELYTSTIGNWSYIFIAASAFSIMFGTMIAVFDGYSRALERSSELLFLSEKKAQEALHSTKVYNISLIIVAIGAYLIIALFLKHFKLLIDVATIISFLIAPLVAIVNFRLVSRKYLPEEAVPPPWLRYLSYAGILFLSGFAIFFIYTKLT